MSNIENRFKVKLVSSRKYKENGPKQVIFGVTPDVTENRSVSYKNIESLHTPGSLQVFAGSSNRSFQIGQAKLLARSAEEADKVLTYQHLLRSWTTPHFGQQDAEQLSVLGIGPEILLFSAYSSNAISHGTMQNIRKVPVVITSLTISYPSDVDYIPSSSGVPVALISVVDIQLTEYHSANDFKRFSLADFRNGKLVGF